MGSRSRHAHLVHEPQIEKENGAELKFREMISALEDGAKVRRKRWEPTTKMFVDDHNELVCQKGECEPYTYQIAWYELTAKDWERCQ